MLFYHFRLPGFGGGFVGVDIFFVISGYLITRIIAAEFAAGRFSMAAFYERRVRRLFPALFLMLAAATILAWLAMMPRGFRDYGESLASLMAGGSNFYFWHATVNYFRPDAETLPLLHSWSLAVEEQFYLAFPIFLAFFLRRGRNAAMTAILVFVAASLLLAAVLARIAPTPAFYFPMTRGWELLIGALLALRLDRSRPLPKGTAGAIGLAGLALMGIAIAWFDSETPMPGLPALVPCLGAAMLIFSGAAGGNVATRLLAVRPLVWIGLVSYGLYLWHWPIYVMLRHHLLMAPLGIGWTLAALAGAIAAAALSFHAVELPIRRRRMLASRRRLFASAAAGALVLMAGGLWIARADGFPGRFPGLAGYALPERVPTSGLLCSARALARDPACLSAAGPADQRRVLIWGDSFAGHYVPAFAKLKDALPFALAQETEHGCPPVFELHVRARPECVKNNEAILEWVEQAGIDTLILGADWEGQRDPETIGRLEPTLRRLRARGLSVIVLGQSPVFNFAYPDEYHYHRMRRGAAASDGRAANFAPAGLNARLRAAAEAAGASFFDPTQALCDRGSCVYREKGNYVVRDSGHLTEYGALKVVERFLQSPEFGAQARMWRERPLLSRTRAAK